MKYVRSMHSKFVLLCLVSMSLVLGTYSSVSPIFGALVECEYNATKTKADCINVDADGDSTRWACEKLTDGNWTCVEVKQTSTPPIPPELSDAIDKGLASVKPDVKPDATIDEDANNDTKVPNDFGGLNDDGGLTIGPE